MIPEHGWKCLWGVFMNIKKKQWPIGLLLCLIVSLKHTNLFFCYPFPYHGSLSGSCCMSTYYLSYFSTSPSLFPSSANFLWTSFVFLWTSCVNFFHKCVIDISLKSQWKFIEWKKVQKNKCSLLFSSVNKNDDTF